ncbi:MAG: helix-turn-helix transcriptional regulator [Spirochaetota bacterium]
MLSAREQEVLALVSRGASNKEIADKLYFSLPTVKSHVRNLMRKTGRTNRYGLIASAAPVSPDQ